MKGRLIALDHIDGREAAALTVDGELEDLLIAGDAPRPGTVYRALIDRPIKGMGGLFLKTPDGPAFLRQTKGLSPGQSLLVQVSHYAERGKAIPVTPKLLFKSRYAIVTPGAPGRNLSRTIREEEERDRLLELAHEADLPDACGLILRSAAGGVPAEEVAEDIAAMADLAAAVLSDAGDGPAVLALGDGPHLLAWRDWSEAAQVERAEGSFAATGIADLIEATRGPLVRLSGGASLSVEPTRALVAVDVNTGSDTSLQAGLKANLAAARALPRALRVRGLGGQIILDPAPMPKKDRRTFESTLKAAFRADEVETSLVGWTALGLYELQRKRARLPLAEVLP